MRASFVMIHMTLRKDRRKSFPVFLLCMQLLAVLAAGCSLRTGDETQDPGWQTTQAGLQEQSSFPAAGQEKQTDDSPETGPIRETDGRSCVYICGCVAVPGVYEVTADTRVYEVVEMAGGMTAEADREWLNLAREVSDGEQIRILSKEEADVLRSAGAAGEEEGTGTPDVGMTDGKVDLNTASLEQLMTLPGIGKAKAEAILSYRKEHGRFGSRDEICHVPGIKNATYAAIADLITVS